MSVAAQTLRPPSKTLMLLEGRAFHELGAFLGALPLLSLAPKGDGHPVLVVHHSGFDVLIPSHSRMGKFSGGKRISMLRGTPGWRRIKPFRSRVTIIWWTDGGLTRKWRWMSASAGGCPNM